MVATCAVDAMLYVLPMLLGRTYDMQNDKVGIDIFEQKYIDEAKKNPIPTPYFDSSYKTIENLYDKQEFLGVSGELGIKISSGLLDVKGAGEYLRDTSNLNKSVEVLVKTTFITATQEINLDAKPLTYWQLLDRNSVGTHVVKSLTYGGEVYASINFVAHKAEDLETIKAEVTASISKSGAFDLDAQGKLEKVARNLTGKAKMEIDYYGTVPLENVPTTLEGLSMLVKHFEDQVGKVNNGLGVAVCAGMRSLSDFDDKFKFLKNWELVKSLDNFNVLFNKLREAKILLINLVSSLPDMVTQEYLDKIIDFSGRLTKTLRVFHDVIGNMDLQKGSHQLSPAETAFDQNSQATARDNRYSTEIEILAAEMKEQEDPNKPRGIYVRWGKRTCGPKATNSLYIGFMTSFIWQGNGAGVNYQCFPENPNLKLDPTFAGLNDRRSKLGGVRFRSMSMFKNSGKNIENKVGSCTVCETSMRPTVRMYPGMLSCPGDWIQEYSGFLVASEGAKNRAEFVCVDYDPDVYEMESTSHYEPTVFPIKMGTDTAKKSTADASLPCVVCSK